MQQHAAQSGDEIRTRAVEQVRAAGQEGDALLPQRLATRTVLATDDGEARGPERANRLVRRRAAGGTGFDADDRDAAGFGTARPAGIAGALAASDIRPALTGNAANLDRAPVMGVEKQDGLRLRRRARSLATNMHGHSQTDPSSVVES